MNPPLRVALPVLAVLLAGVAGFLTTAGAWPGGAPEPAAEPAASPTALPAPDAGVVHISRPAGPPTVVLETPAGGEARVSCSACHGEAGSPEVASDAELDAFHQGLTLRHGELSCLACHNPDGMDTLRRADGRALPYADVMDLCAQCHGPQARDYRRGSHGGMNGYWDLERGGRQRNGCLACHDPHAPAYGQVQPVFPPRSRWRGADGHGPGHSESESDHR